MNEDEAMEVLKNNYQTMLMNCIKNKLDIERFVHYTIYTAVGLSLKYLPDDTSRIIKESTELAVNAWEAINEGKL